MAFRNVSLKGLSSGSISRKVSMGTWGTAKDPSVYGVIEIDMEKTLLLAKKYEERHSVKLTPGHIVAKVFAYALNCRPEINGMIRGSKIYLREHVQLFLQVNIPGEGENNKVKEATLSGLTIPEAENKTLADISREITSKARKVKKHEDKEIRKNLNAFKFVPWWFAKYYLNIASWLIYGLNLNLSFFGLPRDPFGSIMITSVGGLGIDLAFAPLCPYTRVPLLVSVGTVIKKPIVVDDKIVIRPMVSLGITFDHRLMDGVHAAKIAEIVKKSFESPEKYIFLD